MNRLTLCALLAAALLWLLAGCAAGSERAAPTAAPPATAVQLSGLAGAGDATPLPPAPPPAATPLPQPTATAARPTATPLPSPTATPPEVTIAAGETLSSIVSRQFNYTIEPACLTPIVARIAADNGIADVNQVTAGTRLTLTDLSLPFNCHRVAEHENLTMIALFYGVAPARLQAANGLGDADQVRLGQVLVVPIDYDEQVCAGLDDGLFAAESTPTVAVYQYRPGIPLVCLLQRFPETTIADIYNNNCWLREPLALAGEPATAADLKTPSCTVDEALAIYIPHTRGVLYRLTQADVDVGITLGDLTYWHYGLDFDMELITDWDGRQLLGPYSADAPLPVGQTIFMPAADTRLSRWGIAGWSYQKQPVFVAQAPPAPVAPPDAPPGATAVPAPPAPAPGAQPPGSYYLAAALWSRALPDYDTGYCPPVAGSGWSGSLVWPLNPHNIREGRAFSREHLGIDIMGDVGTPVVAAEGGIVVWAGYSTTSLGHAVVLDHGGGWQTYYGHLDQAAALACGSFVGRGEFIGTNGQSGTATFPHVHFILRYYDWALDPLPLLP